MVLGMTMRFSPYTLNTESSHLYNYSKVKKTWHEHDERKMAHRFFRLPLLEKQSEEVISFAHFRSFSVFWLWARNNFLSLTWVVFCR